MSGHVTYLAVASALIALLATSSAQVSVRSMVFRSHIKYRFATTVVTSQVINDDTTRSQEAVFEVILPEEAFISNFSMTVDGVVYPGEVKEKKAAMAQYQEAKQRGQSAGYIKTTARHSNKFDVSVNLKPGSSVMFNLTYQQLLARCHGMYEHKVHLNPGRAVKDLKVEIFLEESRDITNLTTSLKDGIKRNTLENREVTTEVLNPSTHYIAYKPSYQQQLEIGENGINGEFEVKYDVERTSKAGEILMVDGYFVHFFAPENVGDVKPVPKDIVFVLDVSGSMSGTKMRQQQQAMVTILDELGSDDSFNIFSFDDVFYRWRNSLMPVNDETRQDAKDYVFTLHPDGSTDINLAMTKAVEFLLNNRDRSHISMVFFLTDGQPTSGIKSSSQIADNVERNNENVASVFGLAFGDGADYDLIKIVAVQNKGFARKIYEASDASEQVQGFYDEISSTMLQNLTFSYLDNAVEKEKITPVFFDKVFKGADVVIAGKLRATATDIIEQAIGGIITAQNSQGTVNIVLDNNTEQLIVEPVPQDNPYFEFPVDFTSVTEKSWAYLKIKALLKERKKMTYKKKKGSNPIDDEIKQLALKYNFVTPLTSMVATKPEENATQTSLKGDEYGQEQDAGYNPRQKSAYASYRPQPPVSVQSGGFNAYRTGRQGSNANDAKSLNSYSNSLLLPSFDYGLPGLPGLPPPMPTRTRPVTSYKRRGRKHRQRRPYRPTVATATVQPPVPTPAATVQPPVLTPAATVKYVQPTTSTPVPQHAAVTPSTSVPVKTGKTGGRGKKGKKHPNKKCKIVKVKLEGFSIRQNNVTKCVKATNKLENGTYQLFPYPNTGGNTDVTVQLTITPYNGKQIPINVIVQHADNTTRSISFILENANAGKSVYTATSYSGSSGQVKVKKTVRCKGIRGKAKIFIEIDSGVNDSGIRIQRDVRGKMARNKKGKKSLGPAFKQCDGGTTRESLKHKNNRFRTLDKVVGNGTPITRF